MYTKRCVVVIDTAWYRLYGLVSRLACLSVERGRAGLRERKRERERAWGQEQNISFLVVARAAAQRRTERLRRHSTLPPLIAPYSGKFTFWVCKPLLKLHSRPSYNTDIHTQTQIRLHDTPSRNTTFNISWNTNATQETRHKRYTNPF